MAVYFSPLVAFLVAVAVSKALLASRLSKSISDVPNERSLHAMPIPRVGGVGLMAGALAGWLWMAGLPDWRVSVPLLLLFGVSMFDDARGMSVRVRLLAHMAAAAILVAGAGMHWALGIAVVLLVVWMTNLYNFMDGSDGLAGGMALFGFGWYGVAALAQGAESFALVNLALSAAALGFLLFNFHPARMFMGDAGSIPLGFLAAALGLLGWQEGLWPAWYPPLVFSPFVVDASVTLFKRLLRGEKLSQAHRSHYYQRLVQMGWGHRNTALAEYLLMFTAGACGLWSLGQGAVVQLAVLLLWLLVYSGLMVWLDACWKRFMGSKLND
ncbi:MAG TPA: glycosyltransferase family 4 protein [Gallionella sp.]|nr:glycosyltransferase family 4 protein [Gallionella sp.]